jgi:hypothetical protein
VQFDINSEDISQKIQQLPAKSYFSKIYFVANTLAANLIQNGFIEVSGLTFSKLTINGMFQLVDKITIQNQVVAFNKNDFSLLLNVMPSDQVVIDYKDGRNEVVPAQKGFHNITQKPKPSPRPMPGQQKSSAKKSNNNIFFLGGLAAVLGLGLYFFWLNEKSKTNPSDTSQAEIPNKPEEMDTLVVENLLNKDSVFNQIEYKLNGDVLEWTVVDKSNNPFVWKNSDKDLEGIIKFRMYLGKIGIWKPNTTNKNLINTEASELNKIYQKFKLDKLIIEEKLNKIYVNNQGMTNEKTIVTEKKKKYLTPSNQEGKKNNKSEESNGVSDPKFKI